MKTALLLALVAAPMGARAAAPTIDNLCQVTEAPALNVRVVTDDVVYDYSRSTRTLTGVRTDTASPYPKGTDAVTGGLREDSPQIRWETLWNAAYNPRTQVGCITYKSIDTVIHLKPRIFVAREFNVSPCREAVLTHERKHVQVDREVMNKYAGLIGKAIKASVDRTGSFGPFPVKDEARMTALSRQTIKTVVDAQIAAMEAEMHIRQQQVDNINEYKSISAVCRGIARPAP